MVPGKRPSNIYQCNPWLTALPCWHFAHPPASQYQRKAHRSDSLSTLEAAAYGLHLLENIDTAPLLVLQQKRQQFSGQRPD
ncbi:DTW domain-containing protein [Bowmanella denitrificans]|uniref:DTW domain-containing protein n=1 Tax=Bowmanella denitrificans TaxID=366582 RepID=UPI003CD0B57C